MFFVYTPQNPSPVYYDPEEAYLEFKRREYVKQLQEQQRRIQFERELQLEEARHRAALQEIARNETIRRQRMAQLVAQERAQATARHAPRQTQQYSPYQPPSVPYGQDKEQARPTPRDILARRLARQKEEEQQGRQFHQNILSHIFGIPVEEFEESRDDNDEQEDEQDSELGTNQPTLTQLVNELSRRQHLPEQTPPVRKPSLMQPLEHIPTSTTKVVVETKTTPASIPVLEPEPKEVTMETEADEPLDPEPHWSAAPERARSLAEISSIDRTFNALKNTFVFPSGPLERLASSDAPRLAYNSTNATIHAYEHALSDLLVKLDAVESYGFKGVREARKQLVVKIEEELLALDKRIMERLTSGGETTAPDSISVPIEAPESGDVEMNDEAQKVEASAPKTILETHAPVDAITLSTPTTELGESNAGESKATSAIVPSQPLDTTPTPATVTEPVSSTRNDAALETTRSDAREGTNTTTLARSTASPVLPVALPETASDEELEVQDAIHIDDTDDESEAPIKRGQEHKSAVGEFEML